MAAVVLVALAVAAAMAPLHAAPAGTPDLNAVSYIVTQKAMDDAPDRYAPFIQEAIDDANNLKLQDYSSGSGCHDKYALYASRMQKKLTLVPGSLKLTILADGLHVQAKVTVDAHVPLWAQGAHKILFWCVRDTVCDSVAHISFLSDITVDAKVTIQNGVITLQGSPAQVTFENWKMDGCHISSFANWLFDIRDKMNAAMQQGIVNALNQIINQKFNVPQVFQPYPPYPVYISYKIQDMVFTADTQIVTRATVNVIATVNTTQGLVNQTFVDPDADDASLYPPTTWSLQEGPDQFLLNGLRVSSSVLTALAWAGNSLGAFDESANVTVLDAAIVFRGRMDEPTFTVPTDGVLNLTIKSGYVWGVCHDCYVANSNWSKIIDFAFEHVSADGTVTFTNSSQPGIVYQITKVDLDHVNLTLRAPPIPLPHEILMATLKDVIGNSVPKLNKWFKFHALVLPPSVAEYLPEPTIDVRHQPGCCNNVHGFVDMTSSCVCRAEGVKAGPAAQPSCNFKCTAHAAQQKPTSVPELPAADTTVGADTTTTTAPPATTTKSGFQPQTLFLTSFSAPEGMNNSQCSLSKVGMTSSMQPISSTPPGGCGTLPSGEYYALDLADHGNKVASFRTGCDVGCTSCTHSFSSLKLKHCQTVVGYQSTRSFFFHSPADPCSGVATTEGADAFVSFLFQQSSHCETQYSGTVLATALHAPNVSCATLDKTDDTSYYSLMEHSQQQPRPGGKPPTSVKAYELKAGCDATCANCELTSPWETEQQCSALSGGLPNASLALQPARDVLRCAALPAGAQPPWIMRIGLPLFGALCVVIAAVVGWKEYKRRERIRGYEAILGSEEEEERAREPCCGPSHRGVVAEQAAASGRALLLVPAVLWRGVCFVGAGAASLAARGGEIVWVNARAGFARVQYSPNWLLLGQVERLQVQLCGVAAVLQFLHAALWVLRDPFEVFSVESFQSVGLSSKTIRANTMHERFVTWSRFGQATAFGSGVLLLLAVLGSLFVRGVGVRARLNFSSTLAGLLLLAQVMVILLPPFDFQFRDAFQLVHTSNSSTSFFRQDPEARREIESLLGYAFAGIAFGFFANIFIFLVHAIPVGGFVGSVLFAVMCVADQGGAAMSHRLDAASVRVQRTRVLLLNWLLHLLAPISMILGVIIVYQSLGVVQWWFFLWPVLWACSCVLLFLLTRPVAPRWLARRLGWAEDADVDETTGMGDHDGTSKRGAGASASSTTTNGGERKWLLLLTTVYLVLFFGVTGAFLWSEQHLKDGDITFPGSLLLSAASLFAAFIFGGLCHKLESEQEDDAALSVAGTKTVATTTEDILKRPGFGYDDLRQVEKQQGGRGGGVDGGDEGCGCFAGSTEDANGLSVAGSLEDAGDVSTCRQWWRAFRTSPVGRVLVGGLVAMWRFLAERAEAADPIRFGKRLPYRRLFLLIGVGTFTYLVADSMRYYLSTSVKQEVIDILARTHNHIDWPDNGHGGTIFDKAFDEYQFARWVSWGFSATALTLLLGSLAVDVFKRDAVGLKWSRNLGFLAITILYVAAVAPAVPDYLEASHIKTMIPECAPKFNNMVDLITGDFVGLMCAGLFSMSLLFVLLAVPPALVRACKLVLSDQSGLSLGPSKSQPGSPKASSRNLNTAEGDYEPIPSAGAAAAAASASPSKQSESTPLLGSGSSKSVAAATSAVLGAMREEEAEAKFWRGCERNVLVIFRLASFTTPILTVLPLLVFFQVAGDWFVALSISLFWLVPIVVGLTVTYKRLTICYICWLLAYFVPLLSLFFYECAKHGFESFLVNILTSPDTYLEIAAEISLANVILSDVIYVIFFGQQ